MEPPNNGHVGEMASVGCRELSASQRLLKYYIHIWEFNSVPRGLSIIEGLSASRSVRFGRLHCRELSDVLLKLSKNKLFLSCIK